MSSRSNFPKEKYDALLEELRLARHYRVANIARRFGITPNAVFKISCRVRRQRAAQQEREKSFKRKLVVAKPSDLKDERDYQMQQVRREGDIRECPGMSWLTPVL